MLFYRRRGARDAQGVKHPWGRAGQGGDLQVTHFAGRHSFSLHASSTLVQILLEIHPPGLCPLGSGCRMDKKWKSDVSLGGRLHAEHFAQGFSGFVSCT